MVGGLLLAPRPSQAKTPGGAPIAATADPSSGAAAGDRSPRAGSADQTGGADPAGPPTEVAAGGLPDELSLAELFPSEAGMGAATPDGTDPSVAPLVQGGQIGADSERSAHSRWPLLAGLIVTLASLVFGGGFLWWRDRDSNYWPA
ncbi:MAG: hypothetical protein LC792_09205 [Actinobacteria bacterium]|nr:hypothetical protein [Actinomycetota bacterium]